MRFSLESIDLYNQGFCRLLGILFNWTLRRCWSSDLSCCGFSLIFPVLVLSWSGYSLLLMMSWSGLETLQRHIAPVPASQSWCINHHFTPLTGAIKVLSWMSILDPVYWTRSSKPVNLEIKKQLFYFVQLKSFPRSPCFQVSCSSLCSEFDGKKSRWRTERESQRN